MFVSCSVVDNGKLMVVDTDDWVTELVTVEQLKLVQSMGYQVKHDLSYGFIYQIYCSLGSHLLYHHIGNMRDAGFYIPYCDNRYRMYTSVSGKHGVVAFCYMKEDEMVLFSIQKSDAKYKLSYSRDVFNYFKDCFECYRVVPLVIIDDEIRVNIYGNSVRSSAAFDFDHNFKGIVYE